MFVACARGRRGGRRAARPRSHAPALVLAGLGRARAVAASPASHARPARRVRGTVQGGYPARLPPAPHDSTTSRTSCSRRRSLPAAALAVLLVDGDPRPRAATPHARALLAVAGGGGRDRRRAGRLLRRAIRAALLGRDLAALPPLLFCVFALWLARGAPRPRVVTAAARCLRGLACSRWRPWNDLSAVDALPDTFGLALLYSLRPLSPTNVVTVGGARRARCSSSCSRGARCSSFPSSCSRSSSPARRRRLERDQRPRPRTRPGRPGRPAARLDRRGRRRATSRTSTTARGLNSVWQEKFWNHRITKVVSLRAVHGPGADRGRRPFGSDRRACCRSRPRTWLRATSIASTARRSRTSRRAAIPTAGLTLWRLERSGHDSRCSRTGSSRTAT